LAVPVLVAAGVLLKQADVDMSRFGMDPVAAGVVGAKSPALTEQGEISLTALLPDGFKKLSETELYNAENLYEKINGKAPLYTESGFEKLLAQRFASKQDEDLWMELFIYDMASLRNAFSVYSRQKRADVELLPDTRFAYRTGNGLYFVHGKYYVELVGSSESPELSVAMSQTADRIRTKLAVGKDEQIVELAFFPQEGFVPGSNRLYLTSAFGFKDLTNVFTAGYKLRDWTITAFIGRRLDANDARKMAESYHRFLIENGGAAKPTTDGSFRDWQGRVVDFYGTTEIVFAVGPFVAGIHEADDRQAAEELAAALGHKLSKVAEAVRND
jgi:hypothetical protein